MIDSVAVVSGGMDSVTMLHYLIKREDKHPAVLTFSYGQKHRKEIDYARWQAELLGCEIHQIIDLNILAPVFASSALVSKDIAIPDIDIVHGDPQPITYVPNRNMIFLAIAAAFAETLGATDVFYGAQAHDLYGYWDTTPDFLQRINDLLALNRKSISRIKAPLVNLTKSEVLKLGLELDVNFSKTWSCYEGNDLACGRCPTCAERIAAFKVVGVPDPLVYQYGAEA
jgi:7-cyano-7-deazaguanine synthase